MEANTTMSNRPKELDIYNVIYPLWAVYLKMFLLLLSASLMVISSLMVICVVLKNKKLRNINNLLIVNLLIVNLLVSDLMFIVVHFSFNMYLTSVYVFGLEMDDFCNVVSPVMWLLSRVITMMVVPLAVYRVVSVLRPYSYKRIMTKKRIIAMIIMLWVFAVLVTVGIAANYRLVFVPSLAACAVTNTHPVLLLFFVVPEVMSFVLILFASAYLRYKIIKSNRFIDGIQRSSADREKAIRAGRLVEAFMEQVKPTVSVLITGGIDGLFDLFLIAIVGLSSLSSPATEFLVIQTAGVTLLYCQLLSHSLCYGLYNKEVREKMLTFYQQQSKVIALNANA
ncbi:melatonin receptor type 1A-like [Dysidea avara]|uniref:melatonin receptor type 1A-like n=1 Tax=Dysidea avara TaxID=196820 RepID=UPI003319E3C0